MATPMGPQKDSTFEYKIIDFFANQWQLLVAVAILSILVFGGIVTYQSIERSNEKAAQEQLYVLQKAMQDETAAAKTPVTKAPMAQTPDTLAKNYGPLLDKYSAFIQQFRGHKAAYMAAIQAASIAEQYKDFQRAESLLKPVIDQPAKDDLFWGLLKGQYAGVLIRENKCPDAIPVLQAIANNPSHAFLQAHALLRLGACYIQTKRYNQAEDALVRIQMDFPRSAAAFEAHNLKRLILVQRQQTTEKVTAKDIPTKKATAKDVTERGQKS